ncbi:hypothetical protein HMPREF2996_02445 [Corynebacterium sp. HMSC066C02]|uniref:hypothetical protein n=1 Tax=Corynebacterium sp. HMSC066C02 TaxID=1739500 RepID=UPI0008A3AAB8|nr:hypothetical protein [Corynebacterium sp. HMSC066C02]OFP21977.1 hypothetical protein HMPREF2996_02445 [Corynebacterium sp. HMSC066C02]
MTEDDYWERVRDIRKDDQILYDERFTPPSENPDNWRRSNYDPRIHGTRIAPRDEFLVIGAVRYARGRATYVVQETVDWVIKHWDDLSDNTRYVITRDVAEECDYRDNTPRSVLSEIDDPDWNRLLNHIKDNQ